MQNRKLGGLEMNHAVSHRREIVKQANRHAVQRARQRSSGELPRYIGGVRAAVDYRTRHAKACSIHCGGRAKKIRADGLETVEIRGRVAMLAHEFERSRGVLEEPELSFGSADIAGQDEPIHRNLAVFSLRP